MVGSGTVNPKHSRAAAKDMAVLLTLGGGADLGGEGGRPCCAWLGPGRACAEPCCPGRPSADDFVCPERGDLGGGLGCAAYQDQASIGINPSQALHCLNCQVTGSSGHIRHWDGRKNALPSRTLQEGHSILRS